MRGRTVLRRFALALLAACVLATAWAALAPIVSTAPEEVFEIPKGSWARRMKGANISILPDKVHLTLGVNDVLVLKNLDDVPQIFGPMLIMPGQSFRLPFEKAADYSFACTAHANGQMSVIVHAMPSPGWERMRWRARRAFDAMSGMVRNR